MQRRAKCEVACRAYSVNANDEEFALVLVPTCMMIPFRPSSDVGGQLAVLRGSSHFLRYSSFHLPLTPPSFPFCVVCSFPSMSFVATINCTLSLGEVG